MAEALSERLGRTVWRYTFTIPAGPQGGCINYTIGSQTWSIHRPRDSRLRIAYTACNGTEDEQPKDGGPLRNEQWRQLASEHSRSPFHLLIQGGDQLYADTIWDSVPSLNDWWKLPWPNRLETTLTSEIAEALLDFYFDHYCWLWSQREIAPIIASIPSLMMWDDHDIFDGWGSHPPVLQSSPAFQAIWTAAREHFALFQLGLRADEPRPAGFDRQISGHFGWVYEIEGVGIIAPDLRSERTRRQVMGEAGWSWLIEALEQLGHCRRVLFISTVPVANIDLSPLERTLRLVPGHFFYKDDLRDQWRSYAHRLEWRRLIRHLLDFSEQTRTSVTVLSGEIHLGALGCLARREIQLYQLISSGIVHPPPPGPIVWLLNHLSHGTVNVDTETTLRMLPLPGLNKRYLAARNWLSLECSLDEPLRIKWHTEGANDAMTMTIA